MRSLLIGLVAVLAVGVGPIHAQLPTPPAEHEARELVQRLRMEAAGRTTPETRERLEDEVAAATGSLERLQNGAGIILILRGYPWEGLWFLSQSALAEFEQPDVLNNMGLVLTLIEEHTDAERLLLYVGDEWPDFYPAWTNLARLYCDIREYDNAQECLDRANAAQPGTTSAEEVAARMAVERGRFDEAAQHAVNLSNLDPGNPMLQEALPHIPEGDLANAVMARAAAVPLPVTFVDLDEVIDEYEDFVLDEIDRQYWQAVVERFTQIGTDVPYQNLQQLSPEVFNQLPSDMQATLRAMGAGPSEELQVLSPTESRTHYMRLAMHIDRYRRRYQRDLRPMYYAGPVEWILEEQRERLREFHEEYMAALEAGGDPIAAMNGWCRDVITSMSAAHPRFLSALEEARAEANRLTRRHWLSTAGLITMVPEEYQGDEIAFLKRQAALSNGYYAGSLVKWYFMGMRAVVLDRELTTMMADGLHEAARAREREALLIRERIRAEMEAKLEGGEVLDLDLHPWIGLNLGFFSVKVEYESVGVSIGEGVVGDVSYDWGGHEFEMGIGLGYASPTLGPLGGSGKVLGVVRLGGRHGAALGIRDQVQASVGTPVSGVDINVRNDYTWLISAGRINTTL